MSNYPFFYNAVDSDRVYDADSFSDWLKKFFTTGVFVGDLQVTADSGMNVTVGTGYCNINGKVGMYDEAVTLTVSTANASYPRIDTVVVERNDTDRDFYIKIITGAANQSPTAVAPVRTDTIYQIVLAQIRVNAGATSITQSNITDKRADTSVCGYVASTVDEIDFSQIQAQFDAYMEEYKASFESENSDWESTQKAAFDAWYAALQDGLEGDTAANLLSMIQTNASDIAAITVELDSENENLYLHIPVKTTTSTEETT